MTTEYRDGKIRIVVEARTDANQPDTGLQLRGGVTTPAGAEGVRRNFKFVQKNSGQYEAEIKVEDAGSYFLTAQATRQVKVKGKDGKERLVEEGVDSVPRGHHAPLLSRVRRVGEQYEPPGEDQQHDGRAGVRG